jgi:hypothetical protein
VIEAGRLHRLRADHKSDVAAGARPPAAEARHTASGSDVERLVEAAFARFQARELVAGGMTLEVRGLPMRLEKAYCS